MNGWEEGLEICMAFFASSDIVYDLRPMLSELPPILPFWFYRPRGGLACLGGFFPEVTFYFFTLIFLVIFCGLGFGGLLLSFEMIEGM